MSLLSDAKATVAKFLINMSRFDQVMNGDKTVDVNVDVGTVPSLRKLFDFIVQNVVGVVVKGRVDTVASLPPTGNKIGDIYIVTTAGPNNAANDGYVWLGSEFRNVGPIQGPKGDKGDKGDPGNITKIKLDNFVTIGNVNGGTGASGQGALTLDTTRTGGPGNYGNVNTFYTIKADIPFGQFDNGLLSFAIAERLTGGQVFGMWPGVNTPSSGKDYSGNSLNQTFTAGAAIGLEVNCGNRWSDFGLQYTRQGRFTVGVQVIPDVIPASDGPTTTIYPGTFGILLAQSQSGHLWHTGYHQATDTIFPGSLSMMIGGGSLVGGAPQSAFAAQDWFYYALDFARAKFSGALMKLNFASGVISATASPGIGGALPNATQGYIHVEIDGQLCKIPFFKE